MADKKPSAAEVLDKVCELVDEQPERVELGPGITIDWPAPLPGMSYVEPPPDAVKVPAKPRRGEPS
ncbi:MAG: hypothetical protein OXH38_11770 [Chloroflexi bacterium]|nr:hypothetical protein [Chloroflexota bacterium]